MTAHVAGGELATLQPQSVWQLFAELCQVPRPSKQEQQARDFMRRKAAELKLAVREDRAGNMVLSVPASAGCERAPIIVLQGHLDMVCEKNADTQHDFARDPIRPTIGRDEAGERVVHAQGTTLGADNGIGVCLALAAATSPDVQHGPLEILCTVDEEMGMSGAKVLEPDFVKGRRMINLDSEEDDAIYIGCAGGCDSTLTWVLATTAPPSGSEACRVTVAGLRGGHTGGDIHENRANAIKLLVEVLRGAEETERLQLAEFTGGSKRNAIPREACAVVVGPPGTSECLTQAAEQVQATAIGAGEKTCQISVTTTQAPAVVSAGDTRRLLATLAALPHGVLAIVPDIPGLVQTSNSTSTVNSEIRNGRLHVIVGCLSRSSLRPQLHATVRQIAAIGELGGAAVESGNEYPGWAPNKNSPLLATCRSVYVRLFGREPKITAIHAGLECGIIGERMGGQMDMVSIGPRIKGAHSPDERVYVESVGKCWRFLTALLAELAK